MTIREHKVISTLLIVVTLGVGAWIVYLEPEEWPWTSVAFALLSMGLWWTFRVKRSLVSKLGGFSDVPRDEKWWARSHPSEKKPNQPPEPTR